MSNITYQYIKTNPTIKTYVEKADYVLNAMGYTEHSYAHVEYVAKNAAMILDTLGYDERTVELTKIAAYMHDIGNLVNRQGHAQHGAILAFNLLNEINVPPEEIAQIVSAIGHHDEGTAETLNPMICALIIADKTDVRRSRVRNMEPVSFDIHDRVNYAAETSSVYFNPDDTALILDLVIDTNISSVVEYFQIFLGRMMLCQKCALKLGIRFECIINGMKVM